MALSQLPFVCQWPFQSSSIGPHFHCLAILNISYVFLPAKKKKSKENFQVCGGGEDEAEMDVMTAGVSDVEENNDTKKGKIAEFWAKKKDEVETTSEVCIWLSIFYNKFVLIKLKNFCFKFALFFFWLVKNWARGTQGSRNWITRKQTTPPPPKIGQFFAYGESILVDFCVCPSPNPGGWVEMFSIYKLNDEEEISVMRGLLSFQRSIMWFPGEFGAS